MRFFNTEGPVRAEDHYAIPLLKRGNVAEILRLIRDKRAAKIRRRRASAGSANATGTR